MWSAPPPPGAEAQILQGVNLNTPSFTLVQPLGFLGINREDARSNKVSDLTELRLIIFEQRAGHDFLAT